MNSLCSAKRLWPLWIRHLRSHPRQCQMAIRSGRRLYSDGRQWLSKDVRSTFIDFFKQWDHLFVPSSSVIPKKNEGSYFVNAGMNQFKPLFLGTTDPQSAMSSYKRVVNSQKCIRVGGKHNDLEDVGRDLYHHTFFEMLGSWSFNDYFKRDACTMAWRLLTEVYGLPASHLYVTYFGGSEKGVDRIEADVESRDIWLDIGIPSDRVLPFGLRDNFWMMGDTGPCGPCTEIHYNRTHLQDASKLVNTGCPDVLELWNLVFMQFDKKSDGSLKRLPLQHVDTGMGLERITAVLQNKTSNYDTDLFLPLFTAIHKGCGCPAYSGTLPGNARSGAIDTAYRTVADHSRMFTVAIADGLLPGRRDSEFTNFGYLLPATLASKSQPGRHLTKNLPLFSFQSKLREIIYRSVHCATHVLGAKPGLIGSLVPIVVESLGGTFPEIAANPKMIVEVVDETERRYLSSVEDGRKVFGKALQQYGNITQLADEQLHDIESGRFGKPIPVDIVAAVASFHGITVDLDRYENFLQASNKAQSPVTVASVSQSTKSLLKLDMHEIEELKIRCTPRTDDSAKYIYTMTSDGTSYEFPLLDAKIVAMRRSGKFVDSSGPSDRCDVFLDQSCFYSEAGGQAADHGSMETKAGSVAQVTDVQSTQQYVAHAVHLISGSLQVGDRVRLRIDHERRIAGMANHTATHIISSVLSQVLGGVRQQGSMVNDTKLMFDFTCDKMSVSDDDLVRISAIVNEIVNSGAFVYRDTLPLSEARRIKNLVTMTDQVYPEQVHVVSIGAPVKTLLGSTQQDISCCYSAELCGGTHVSNVRHLTALVITQFQGSAQGTKRIVAVTRRYAEEALQNARTLREALVKLSSQALTGTESLPDMLETAQSIDRVLSGRGLLSKVDREQIQTELNRIMYSMGVNRAKNSNKIEHLTQLLEKTLSEKHAEDSAVIAEFSFDKTREIVEALAALSPACPVLLACASKDKKNNIVGVLYFPKMMPAMSFSASEWANHICKTGGNHSTPKGKLSKHTNIEVFSITTTLGVDSVLSYARTFTTLKLTAKRKQSEGIRS